MDALSKCHRRCSLLGNTASMAMIAFSVARCGGGPGTNEATAYFDLVEQFSTADVQTETHEIDFGIPSARGHLMRGWSFDEVGLYDEETSFVWSDGSSSEIHFFLGSSRELRVIMRCAPFEASQEVSVSVNGKRVGTLELQPGPKEYEFTIPAHVLAPGTNRMEFRYRSTIVAGRVTGSNDPRHLAVGVDYIRFGVSQTGQVEVDPRSATIRISSGSQVDYYFSMSPESFLDFGVVETPGPGVRLVVELQHHPDRKVEILKAFEGTQGRTSLFLPQEASPIVRLSLRAEPSRGSVPGEGLTTVVNPIVRAPAPASAGDETATVDVPKRPRNRPNVVIYVIDALRADHLGCYGYWRTTSPNIDAFARDATLFEYAFAQSAWTRAAISSLFTGYCPRYHQVNDRNDALSPEASTLAEILSAEGYDTAAFVTNVNLDAVFGFDQGFEQYVYLPPPIPEIDSATSEQANQMVLSWLEGRRAGDSPFLLYIHTTDPHGPYTPALLSASRSKPIANTIGSLEWLHSVHAGQLTVSDAANEELRLLYDEEIRFNDGSFGEFVSRLKALGYYEDTLIVLLSDHGEEFGEHGGWEHGRTLYHEQLRIPLVVKFPRPRPYVARVVSPVQQIDVFPTVLEEAGINSPGAVEGLSLRNAQGARRVFSYLGLDGFYAASLIDWPFKLIHQPARETKSPWLRLYHLAEDPSERNDIIERYPVLGRYLFTLTKGHWHQDGDSLPRSTTDIDEELLERLKALGYIR